MRVMKTRQRGTAKLTHEAEKSKRPLFQSSHVQRAMDLVRVSWQSRTAERRGVGMTLALGGDKTLEVAAVG